MNEEPIINGIDVSEEILINGKKITELSDMFFEYCKLKKENEHLREENEELKEMLSKEPKAMQAFQIAYSGLKKENEVLWGMVKDYKTALEEIRKIGKQTGCMRFVEIVNEVLNDRD